LKKLEHVKFLSHRKQLALHGVKKEINLLALKMLGGQKT